MLQKFINLKMVYLEEVNNEILKIGFYSEVKHAVHIATGNIYYLINKVFKEP